MFNSTMMDVSPDQKAQWDTYLAEARQKAGLSESSPPDQLASLYRKIRDEEVERGLTITEGGERLYLSQDDVQGAGGTQSSGGGGVGNLKSILENDETGQKKQLILWSGLIVLGLIVMIGYMVLGDFKGFDFGGKKTPIPEETEVPTDPIDYSVLLSSLSGDVKSNINRPESLEFDTVTYVIEPSNSSNINKGEVWCNLEAEVLNKGCWLSGTIVNPIIGLQDASFQYFKNAKEGDTIIVRFGPRKVVYTISAVRDDVSFNDTSVFSQPKPQLTLVFFAPLTEDGERENIATRKVITAYPDQNDTTSVTQGDDTPSASVSQYVGPNTAITLAGKAVNMTQSVYPINNGDSSQYLKVIYDFVPADGNIESLASLIYSLDTDLTYVPSQQMPYPAKKSYRVVFTVQNTGDGQAFSLNAEDSATSAKSIVSGTISSPKSMEYVKFDLSNISAEYQFQSKLFIVHLTYTMDADASAELCSNCALIIAGQEVLPNPPVYFTPTENGAPNTVNMMFQATITPTNLSNIQLRIGNNTYMLNSQQASQ